MFIRGTGRNFERQNVQPIFQNLKTANFKSYERSSYLIFFIYEVIFKFFLIIWTVKFCFFFLILAPQFLVIFQIWYFLDLTLFFK